MKSFGAFPFAVVIGAMTLLAGCATTSGDTTKNTVTIKKGSFETSDAGLGNDIKSILAQGGLDTKNPAGAVPSAVVDDTPKVLSTTATDLQTLVAQLDANSAISSATPALATPKTAQTTSALALAEKPKSTPAADQIETTITNTTFAPIGQPGELIPIVPPVVAETGKEKPVAKSTKPKSRLPVQKQVSADTATTYKKPTVKRF